MCYEKNAPVVCLLTRVTKKLRGVTRVTKKLRGFDSKLSAARRKEAAARRQDAKKAKKLGSTSTADVVPPCFSFDDVDEPPLDELLDYEMMDL